MLKRVEKPEWLRVAEEFEASGLTQREFAGRRGLRLSTLQSWVYRRRRQGSAVAEPPVRLLPVQVSRAPAASAPGSVEVVLVGGMRVRVSPDADVDYVARLVAALGRTAC
ncbi:IS66 family insertion sequence element accessory protein TnpB [Pyxidicoccus fallax]|uniref:IS66 family insertion sequence element accessory protein TnpB n=1 Tax=Pyxidicoccus fallax TaxID=394095 RepID=A0A848LCH2_9BACT|nr:IS66 family insertion sequence element accessory protein TnpB [Pyxidicoccus fallax]NMO16164.1 IS66 family insertion sequence element accessory protein TnpB [Pyxidicoccus fallax]NPC78695.1 IS66 family insertion sequence element accessory protein TnpB [Pyxidicoccus fallax]